MSVERRIDERPGQLGVDRAWDSETDVDGNTYVTGEWYYSAPDDGSRRHAFLEKFDASCNLVWRRVYGVDGGFQIGFALALDGDGDVALVMTNQGTMSFDDGTSTTDPMVVAKIRSDGTTAWVRAYPPEYGRVSAVAAAADGDVVVGGTYSGTLTFGGDTFETTPGVFRNFIVRFDADGEHVWSHDYLGGGVSNGVREVEIGADGDVYISAEVRDDVDFGGPVLPYGSTDPNTSTAIARLRGGDGAHVWSHIFDELGYPFLEVDRSGNAIVAGHSWGGAELGDGPAPIGVYLLSLAHATGQIHFAHVFVGATQCAEPGVDANGLLVMTACVYPSGIDFGGGLVGTAAAGTPQRLAIARFDADGEHLFSAVYGLPPYYSPAGGVAATGRSSGGPPRTFGVAGTLLDPIDFGLGTLVPPDTRSVGGRPRRVVYVARFSY